MKATKEHNERIADLVFSDIYPLYLNRIVKNGRAKEELDQVLMWITGYNQKELDEYKKNKATYKEFFKNAKFNPKAKQIKGVVCGYRIEELENRLTKKCRQMEKLIDELARGIKMDKILRT